MTLEKILQNTEREVLSRAMKRYGTQSKMAMALGVNQSTIARKLVKYGLK
jgi:TyrR family helix-turn-helix protein